MKESFSPRLVFSLVILVITLIGFIIFIISKVPGAEPFFGILFPFLEPFGISIITLTTVTFVWDHFSKEYLLRDLEGLVEISTDTKKVGIDRVYCTRKDAFDSIKKAVMEANNIDLLGGSLTMFFHTASGPQINPNDFLSKGATVRVLLPEPCSQGAKTRQVVDGKETKKDQESCLGVARNRRDEFPNTMDVHTYKSLPDMFLVVTEKKVFYQPYNFFKRGVDSPVYEASNGSKMYDDMKGHFERFFTEDGLSNGQKSNKPENKQ